MRFFAPLVKCFGLITGIKTNMKAGFMKNDTYGRAHIIPVISDDLANYLKSQGAMP